MIKVPSGKGHMDAYIVCRLFIGLEAERLCGSRELAAEVLPFPDPHVGDDISYFIYDMEFGKNFDKYHIQRSDEEEPVPMRTIEEAWDYFVSEHPEIVDEEDSK